MIIASIAEADDCTLVTDNTRHFIGLKALNPIRIDGAPRGGVGSRL